ncbi:MAG: CHAT domain-containing protein [Xanthomonadales bacterium]|nr:CHAT domain-containing protein [Xanthomonadales bacterium]
MKRPARRLLWLALALSGVCHADRIVIELPPGALPPGIDLARGDRLQLADGSESLDALLRASAEAANVAVPLTRLRDGESATLPAAALTPGLITLPVSALQHASLDALLGEGPAAEAALSELVAATTSEAVRAEALALKARHALKSQRFADAQADLQQALAAAPALAGPLLQTHLQQFERWPDRQIARAFAERLLAAQAGAPPALRAQALLLRARVRAALRDHPGAEADLAELRALAPSARLIAQAQSLSGLIALRQGQRAEARRLLEGAEATLLSVAADTADWAEAHLRRLTLDGIEGRPEALPGFEQLIAALERRAPGSSLLGGAAFNAHLIAFTRRDYARAEAFARTSERALTASAPGTLALQQAQTGLGEVLLRRGASAEALAVFEAALRTAEAIDATSYEALSTRLQRALAKERLGLPAAAIEDADTVLTRYAALPDAHPLRSTQLEADARLFRSGSLRLVGRLDDARSDAARALEFRLQRGNALAIAEARVALAEAERAAGRPLAAAREADAVLALYREAQVDGQALAIAQLLRARLHAAAGERDAALSAYAQAQQALEAHRARVGGDEDVRARWAAQYRAIYVEPLLLHVQQGEAGAALEAERRYRQAALRRFAQTPAAEAPTPAASAPGPRPADRLAPEQALLSFVVADTGVVAWVHRAGHAAPSLQFIPIARGALAERIEALRVLASRGDLGAAGLRAFVAQSHALYRDLLAPLQPALQGSTRWLISPDDVLRSLPWAALATADATEPTWLIERVSLSQTVSPEAYALAHAEVEKTSDGDAVIGLAASLGGTVRAAGSTPPPVLPGARDEVLALADLYGARATLLLDQRATEAELRRALQQQAVNTLHLAVHGERVAHDPMASYLQLAIPAGASAPSTDDGALSAREIAAELRLGGGLVVLSACDSALGGDAGGEGLLGLMRAFHAAGAEEVMGTLWRVADRPTAQLMRHFHERRLHGDSSEEAMAQAQRAWLQRARQAGWMESLARWLGFASALPEQAGQPFYWAGFALESRAHAR